MLPVFLDSQKGSRNFGSKSRLFFILAQPEKAGFLKRNSINQAHISGAH